MFIVEDHCEKHAICVEVHIRKFINIRSFIAPIES